MRLDHLLSKETSSRAKRLLVTSYGQYKMFSLYVIQFRGYSEYVPNNGEENKWGFSSAGRAPALQAGGQRFDPANLHQKEVVWANSSAG